MTKALVTGSSGFVGGHLVEALVQQGVHVRCLVRRSSKIDLLQPLGVEFSYAGLSDVEGLREAIADVDTVYHLAAMTSSLKSVEIYRANALGTATLLHACSEQTRPPVVVYVSSVAAAGPVPRHRLRTEAERPAPVSHYGRSKRSGELAAERWASQVPITVVRPGIVFGPRNREMFPVFHGIDRFGVHLIPTFTPPPLSILHIADLVPAILAAAERGERLPAPGSADAPPGRGYYFACTSEYPNYRRLGRMIGDALGRKRVRLWCMAEPLPWLVGGVGEIIARIRGRADALNIDKIREATVPSWACSNEKARSQLGLHPAATLEQRLAETAAWYRTHGWL